MNDLDILMEDVEGLRQLLCFIPSPAKQYWLRRIGILRKDLFIEDRGLIQFLTTRGAYAHNKLRGYSPKEFK